MIPWLPLYLLLQPPISGSQWKTVGQRTQWMEFAEILIQGIDPGGGWGVDLKGNQDIQNRDPTSRGQPHLELYHHSSTAFTMMVCKPRKPHSSILAFLFTYTCTVCLCLQFFPFCGLFSTFWKLKALYPSASKRRNGNVQRFLYLSHFSVIEILGMMYLCMNWFIHFKSEVLGTSPLSSSIS